MDSESGLVHTVKVTAVNEYDATVAADLLIGGGESVCGDSGYPGAENVLKSRKTSPANGFTAGPTAVPAGAEQFQSSKARIKRRENEKASMRAKAEHVFAVVKQL